MNMDLVRTSSNQCFDLSLHYLMEVAISALMHSIKLAQKNKSMQELGHAKIIILVTVEKT